MEQLDHLTSEQLVGKFSTVSNYAVLVGERENKLFIRGNSFLYRSTFWFVWLDWSLLLEKRRSDNSRGNIIRWSLHNQRKWKYKIWNMRNVLCLQWQFSGIELVWTLSKYKILAGLLFLFSGGRNMGVFPVTCSITASFMSAITLIGMPAEIYTAGTTTTVSSQISDPSVAPSCYCWRPL